ncbi:hypothetical protein [Ancylobacter sp. G4_0304]|uniref:hypothetical protein n=1 Tax=Ancylobacter sp. G4_0304 TaxID=3114289 RepID=UPI0039C669FD
MTPFDSHAAGEPRLDDILADPLVALVLKRDRLDAREVAQTLAREQRRLQHSLSRRPAALSLAA